MIDHIYSGAEENISCVAVKKLTISYHYAIFGKHTLTSFGHKGSHHTIKYRSFKTFDENSFKNDLNQVPWEILSSCDDVNEMVCIWNSLFLEVVNKHAPLRQHRVRRPHQPEWLTPEILDHIKERNKCKINGNHDKYVFLRNKVSLMIRLAKTICIKQKSRRGRMIHVQFG